MLVTKQTKISIKRIKYKQKHPRKWGVFALAQRKGFEAKTLCLKVIISKGFRIYCPNSDP